MLQLHLACEQRIGVILVGPSGSGKSTLWQTLEGAYAHLGRCGPGDGPMAGARPPGQVRAREGGGG